MTRTVALQPHRQARARSMRALAGKMQKDLPGMTAHMHLRDAAMQMERGNTEGTFRHLYAATHALQPQALYRHGHLTDDVHAAAKQNMGLVHREILKSRDIEDMENQNQNQMHKDEAAQNQANIDRMRAEKLSAAETPAAAPAPSPAMNAPGPVPSGGPDPSVAGGPKPPPATTSQNHSNAGQRVIELDWAVYDHLRAAQVHEEGGDRALADVLRKRVGRSPGKGKRARLIAGELRKAQVAREGGDEVEASMHLSRARIYAAQDAAEMAGDADAIELVGPKGYVHGWIKVGPPTTDTFGYGTKPGSFEHLQAIEDLSQKAAMGPTGDPAHASPTLSSTLHHMQNSIALRNIDHAKVQMKVAEWANRHEAGGAWTKQLADLKKQLDQVPRAATGWQNRTPASAISRRGEHPGRYVAGADVPANPTAGATRQYVTATMANGRLRQLELSAETGALAITPHPFGKPGGPGLWGVKNMQLPPYVQNIAHALLRTGRAKTIGQAIAMARAATKRWLHGKNTKPEVRAASGASDAEWRAKQAVAHADHSVTDADLRAIYALACQLTAGEVAIELAQLSQ